MSYRFNTLSSTEFTVKGHRIYKDSNNQWISNPPIEEAGLQKEVNNYIKAIDD